MFLAAALLPAQTLETQNGFDTQFEVGPVTIVPRLRFRSLPEGSGFYQVRVGPEVFFEHTGRVRYIGGYFFEPEAPDGIGPWLNFQRVFAAVDAAITQRRWGDFETRTMFERFFEPQDDDFNRYRQRFRLMTDFRVSPFLGTELFFRTRGLTQVRYTAGFRFHLRDDVILDVGAFYDARYLPGLDNRIIVFTTLSIRRIGRVDPDF